jgi:hypothetical protein
VDLRLPTYWTRGRVDTKVPTLEEARSRVKALGLPILEIEGDYEELDPPRERSQSSVSASGGEGGQAIVGNGTQAARDTAPERLQNRRLLSPMPRKLSWPLLANRSERRLRSGAAEKMTGNHPRNTGPMLSSLRCGAKTRSGKPCRSPAVAGKRRCRMHGGAPGSGAFARQ